MGETVYHTDVLLLFLDTRLGTSSGPLGCPFPQMAPSRQERRQAERDAAKRAQAQAAAAGAASALANLRVIPDGDWSTQDGDPTTLFRALGAGVVEQQAAEGDRAAQYSQGYRLLREVAGADGAGLSGAAGRSPQVEVGMAHEFTFRSLTRLSCVDGHTY